MFIVDSYSLAVIFCVVTMLCWGSWGNTQKLAGKTWRYELFYWDYVIGILAFSLLLGFTLGSKGDTGRGFVEDLKQISMANYASAFTGGVIFNLSNILLSASGSYGIKYYSQYDECHTTEQDYCIAFRFTEIIDENT